MIARRRERHAALADMISFYEVATPLTYWLVVRWRVALATIEVSSLARVH